MSCASLPSTSTRPLQTRPSRVHSFLCTAAARTPICLTAGSTSSRSLFTRFRSANNLPRRPLRCNTRWDMALFFWYALCHRAQLTATNHEHDHSRELFCGVLSPDRPSIGQFARTSDGKTSLQFPLLFFLHEIPFNDLLWFDFTTGYLWVYTVLAGKELIEKELQRKWMLERVPLWQVNQNRFLYVLVRVVVHVHAAHRLYRKRAGSWFQLLVVPYTKFLSALLFAHTQSTYFIFLGEDSIHTLFFSCAALF